MFGRTNILNSSGPHLHVESDFHILLNCGVFASGLYGVGKGLGRSLYPWGKFLELGDQYKDINQIDVWKIDVTHYLCGVMDLVL